MLRSWTDRLFIYLHPEHIVLVHKTGLFRLRVTESRTVPVEHKSDNHWDGVLATLQTLLPQPEWRGMRATVVLSSHWTPLMIAPWEARLSAPERAILLQHKFAEIYGEDAHRWSMHIADGEFGKAGLACASDPVQIQHLREIMSAADIRLVSIKPHLAQVFKRHRKRIQHDEAWFVLAEPGMLTAALIGNGMWIAIRRQPWQAQDDQALAVMLTRMALPLSRIAADYPVYYASTASPGHLPALAGYAVTGLAATAGGRYAPSSHARGIPALCD